MQVIFKMDKVTITTLHGSYEAEHSDDGLYYIRDHILDHMLLGNEDNLASEYAYTSYVQSNNIIDNQAISKSYSTKQKTRAADVLKLHYMLGHPSNITLKSAIESGNIINTNLVAADVDIYAAIYGPCPHCVVGKVNKPSYESSTSAPKSMIGERVHMDLKQMKEQQADGGHTWLLISVDQYSGYMHAVTTKTKSKEDVWTAFKIIIAWYKSYNHRIHEIMTDSESTFKSLQNAIRLLGIKALFTTPYQHEQRIERHIQVINQRIRCTLASLNYVLPGFLYAELVYEIINNLNFVPNALHPTSTPNVLFEGTKFDITTYKKPTFGTPALFHQVSKDNTNSRSQLGIVLSYVKSSHGHQVRAWIIEDKRIKIRSHYTIIRAYPKDLQFKPKFPTVTSHVEDYFKIVIRNNGEPVAVDSIGSNKNLSENVELEKRVVEIVGTGDDRACTNNREYPVSDKEITVCNSDLIVTDRGREGRLSTMQPRHAHVDESDELKITQSSDRSGEIGLLCVTSIQNPQNGVERSLCVI
jgi:hypothetical protein